MIFMNMHSRCVLNVAPTHVYTREVLMQDSSASSDDLCSTISSLPCQLSAEDIDDFFSLALYYAARTPQSFRKVGAVWVGHHSPSERWVQFG